eukprot:CAMPEP_0119378218 /NCGR_PEP_ID=MMETSP1334-20130426/47470_1 /TAXON_ID=127549 /ORGANISM="Calcidiscus leptoporus, Strain RCC1130" /LENGTH=375 /DNA_ID=CAMNT_0007397351 /DNA_START=184 /DNA_END=1311 /DNA_ORIENTATION=+
MTSEFESENVFVDEMLTTAKRISRDGYGILATDESIPTAGKRLASIGVDNTYNNRRAFRELLYTTEDLGRHISGVIMFDETLYQRSAGGVRFVNVLRDQGILTGIKVDTGLQNLAGTNGETATQGLDGLGERCKAYRAEGASFAKWRAVLKIGSGMPSDRAISENAHALARYASICQEHGLVPIVEPEVTLSPGDYSIERAAYEGERVLSHVMRVLNQHDVIPEAMILKVSMALPGLDAVFGDSCKEEVAKYTVRTMKRCVPPAVAGIHFLSGGMGAEEATQNLQALQRECPHAPWTLSFSFGRALQDAVLKEWGGKEQNVQAAQQLLLQLARVNSEAQRGVWDEEHPTPGGGRLSLPKLSYSSERRRSADLFNW